ncbi:mitochondrial ribonuclease P protein 1 homolog [Maniola hyperantus]|uniref:mitochondrial ribonuclease P protein 1 homolog n=1 Tax=Aphantopus hyperantus TaxID=2795564 RepID=UPI001567D1B2|nr:mitochondrial ribonuclease P protein 1 homolog [Maniola hyperantus]
MHCLRSLVSRLRRPIKNKSLFLCPYKKIAQEPPRFYSININVDDDSDTVVYELCKGDHNLEKKLKVLMLEVEVMRQDGRYAPDSIQKDQWKRLLDMSTRNQRTNYLTFLWKLEKKKENLKAKKEARRKELEESPPEEIREYPDDLLYGIKHQSMFLRIRDQSINMFDNYRALQAMIHGQSVIIDCSYEEHMVWRETVNAAKQMTFVFGDNRIHKDPFNLHMCNVDPNGEFMKQLRKNIPSLEEPWFPLNIHTKGYLDLFPKQKLVYLTPHCREELTYFDPDAVYIVGCMVDKINNEPLSLAKAKRDGLAMAKLPLDRYLEWAPGSKKNLNINHMIPILLDLKLTGDWEFALRHIPRRKLMETKILAMQKRFSNSSLNKEDLFKSFKSVRRNSSLTVNEKKLKSRKSLYDDDNII